MFLGISTGKITNINNENILRKYNRLSKHDSLINFKFDDICLIT